MTETLSRRGAQAAATELLQPRVELIGDLADAARAVDAAVEAHELAARSIGTCQGTYAERRRAAIAAGWTDDQLSRLGWAAAHGPRPPRCQRGVAAKPGPRAAAAPAPDVAGSASADLDAPPGRVSAGPAGPVTGLPENEVA